MNGVVRQLEGMPLFDGIASGDFEALLGCIGARTEQYEKGDFISLMGDEIHFIGVVLQGNVQIIKEDVFGNRAILNDLEQGAVFGESYICRGDYSLTVSIQAVQPSTILFLSFERVMQTCSSACNFHNTLIKNMLVLIADKNLRLIEKLEVTTKHSLREKILTYLSQLAQTQRSTTVISPLGRIDLADFLGADRSALTRELNKLRDEGLIEFEKNTFKINNIQV